MICYYCSLAETLAQNELSHFPVGPQYLTLCNEGCLWPDTRSSCQATNQIHAKSTRGRANRRKTVTSRHTEAGFTESDLWSLPTRAFIYRLGGVCVCLCVCVCVRACVRACVCMYMFLRVCVFLFDHLAFLVLTCFLVCLFSIWHS